MDQSRRAIARTVDFRVALLTRLEPLIARGLPMRPAISIMCLLVHYLGPQVSAGTFAHRGFLRRRDLQLGAPSILRQLPRATPIIARTYCRSGHSVFQVVPITVGLLQ